MMHHSAQLYHPIHFAVVEAKLIGGEGKSKGLSLGRNGQE